MKHSLRWLCFCVAATAACSGPTRTEFFDISEPIRELHIDNGSGDVTLRATATKQTRIEALIEGEETEIRDTLIDGVLTLGTDCGGASVFSSCSIQYDIEVPAHAVLAIETGSGDIFVSDATAASTLSTGSGCIELDQFSGDSVELDTGSGSITALGLHADDLSADTGSGDVTVEFASPPTTVGISTGSGDVALTLPTAAYHIDADTGSGDVSMDGITVQSSSPATITIDTGSGDVDILGR